VCFPKLCNKSFLVGTMTSYATRSDQSTQCTYPIFSRLFVGAIYYDVN